MDQQGGSLIRTVFGECAGCQIHDFTPVFHEQGACRRNDAAAGSQCARLVETVFHGGQVAGDVVLLPFDSRCGMILVLGSQQVQPFGEFVVFGGQPGQKFPGVDLGEHEMGSASECFLEPPVIVFVAGRESAPSCGLLFDTREHS